MRVGTKSADTFAREPLLRQTLREKLGEKAKRGQKTEWLAKTIQDIVILKESPARPIMLEAAMDLQNIDDAVPYTDWFL